MDITPWRGGYCRGGFRNVKFDEQSKITGIKGFVQLDQRGSCQGVRLVILELFHALGFSHMQKRPDREEQIRINWENVEPRQKKPV